MLSASNSDHRERRGQVRHRPAASVAATARVRMGGMMGEEALSEARPSSAARAHAAR